MGFSGTGLKASYEALNGAEHELLEHDFRYLDEVLAGNPFHEFFVAMSFDEVVLPNGLPPVGMVDQPAEDDFLLAVGA
jgi:hypothetical protein